MHAGAPSNWMVHWQGEGRVRPLLCHFPNRHGDHGDPKEHVCHVCRNSP
jgi:hypothetical protein